MRCRHQWEDLYANPGDSGFRAIYESQALDAIKQCKTCGAIGKRSDSGTILQLPPKKWETHKTNAATWQKNLKTFAISLEQCN